jgi:hypothetical protein
MMFNMLKLLVLYPMMCYAMQQNAAPTPGPASVPDEAGGAAADPVVPGSDVRESEWQVGDSGNCHECGLSLSWDDCQMSEDLPGDLMLCEGCIDERQTESEAAAVVCEHTGCERIDTCVHSFGCIALCAEHGPGQCVGTSEQDNCPVCEPEAEPEPQLTAHAQQLTTPAAAEDEDEPDPRYNSHEAFAEWFNGEVRSLDDVEGAGENFDTVMEEWCRNNNHEIRDDGVYNMNIPEAGNQDQEGALRRMSPAVRALYGFPDPGWQQDEDGNWHCGADSETDEEPAEPEAPEASETRKETTAQSCQRGYQDRADELQPLLDCGFGPGRHFGTEADWQCGMIEYGQCCYEAADAPADTCFVCMDDISAGDASANPGCMHNLHLHCFMQLMRHGIQQCGICSRQYGLPVLAPAPAPAPRHNTFFRALAPAPAQPTCSPSEAPQGPLPTCPVPGSTGFLTAQAALAWLGSNPETYSPFYVPFLHAVYQTGLLTEQIEVWRDLVGHDIWDEFVRRYRIAMTIGGRRLDNRDPGHNGVNGYIAAAHQDWLINIDPALGQELMQTILQMQQQQPAAAAGGGAAAGMRIHLS